MKIELTGSLPTGGNSPAILLCNGVPSNETEPYGPLDQWGFETPRQIQISQPVRGEFTNQFYRGNRSSRLGFTALRKFASFKDAEAFCLDHERNLPKGGTLKLTTDSSAGAAQRTIANCELQSVSLTNMGRSVLIRYEFIGGKPS